MEKKYIDIISAIAGCAMLLAFICMMIVLYYKTSRTIEINNKSYLDPNIKKLQDIQDVRIKELQAKIKKHVDEFGY